MKRYGFRIWVANFLIVGAFSVIVFIVLARFIPQLSPVPELLFETLVLIVCAIALLFAILEAVLLYREWKAAASEEGADSVETAPPEAEDNA